MGPIGNKPFGFYWSSIVYTMSLFNSIKIKLYLLFIVKGKNLNKFYLWYIVVSQCIKLFIFMFDILYI